MTDHCTHHRTTIQLARRGRGMSFVQRTATTTDCRVVPGCVTIDTLPDEVLLCVFDFCMRAYESVLNPLRWVRLLHVCQTVAIHRVLCTNPPGPQNYLRM